MSIPASDLASHSVDEPDRGDPELSLAEKIAGRSPVQLAMARFRKDRLSMVSFWIVVVYLVIGVLAPFAVHFGLLDPYSIHNSSKYLDIAGGSVPRGSFGGISWSHPFGIEPGVGRDVASRLIYGITFSLVIGLSATIVALTIGTVLGIVGGFVGGWVDAAVGRFTDLTLSFPQTLMLLSLSGLFVSLLVKGGVPAGDLANGTYLVLVLGAFGWPPIARIMRGQVLSIREREFIEAARLIGTPRLRMYFKEVLPNLWAPLLIYFTLTMPAYISAEAALSFLGVGIKPPTPTLGNILTDSIAYSQADFIFFFTPAFLIALIVVSFNLLGDGMRDALDPRGAR